MSGVVSLPLASCASTIRVTGAVPAGRSSTGVQARTGLSRAYPISLPVETGATEKAMVSDSVPLVSDGGAAMLRAIDRRTSRPNPSRAEPGETR